MSTGNIPSQSDPTSSNKSVRGDKKTIFHNLLSSLRKEYVGIIPHRAAVGAVTTAIPIYVISRGGTPTDAGFILFMGSIGTLLGAIVWGNVSSKTRLDYRFLILIGILSFSVSTFLIVVVEQQFLIMSFIYFVLNFSFAATIPGLTKMVFKLFSKEEWEKEHGRLNSISGWAWTSGILFCVILSMLIETSQIIIIFGIVNSISIIILVFALKGIKERGEYSNLYRRFHWERPRFAPLLLFLVPSFRSSIAKNHRIFFSFVFLVFFITGIAAPQVIIYAKYQIKNEFWPYVLSFIWNTASNLWYVRVSERLKITSTMNAFYHGTMLRLLGLSILSFGISCNVNLVGVLLSVISTLVLGISWSYISISNLSYIGRRCKENERDEAIALYNFFNGLGLSLGNFIGGICVDSLGFLSTFLLVIIMLIIGATLMSKVNIENENNRTA